MREEEKRRKEEEKRRKEEEIKREQDEIQAVFMPLDLKCIFPC